MLNESEGAQTAAPTLELVRVAAECVRRNGVRGFRLSEVATAAGVSRGTVYNTFGDKQAAINAGLAYLCTAFIDGLAAAVTPKETLRSQIGEAAALIYEHATTPQALVPPLRTESIIATLLEHYGDQLCRTWAAFWASLVAEAQRRGEVDPGLDPMQAGDWIVRGLLSLEILPFSVAGFSNADDARSRIGDLMLDGLTPRR
ncbi:MULTISPECIES: TetR/AcrR family transcriptional regulator [Rhodococcus]|uniref:TetR/AcrR family transcriptional regulator n=1 Tax=Rhodococcus TaxID=1827 RepID=UPI000BC72EDC|nr:MULTISPECIES: TetR/AcrR family transcriptional regulator [Rhodococcus]MBP1161937.1 AcrR family transcriptional regulator [Rhodococcus sp. PvR099]MCZ4557699.1 TetR/AcrR family transcriptional regulator [Rhodococcus maanshanensis]PTR43353.1 TetR family transcriptional regulator [Rhodococcus sp. OK611]SNX91216.1 transcriptional regulator, TetR family [Rhodococcus sp. OK270]